MINLTRFKSLVNPSDADGVKKGEVLGSEYLNEKLSLIRIYLCKNAGDYLNERIPPRKLERLMMPQLIDLLTDVCDEIIRLQNKKESQLSENPNYPDRRNEARKRLSTLSSSSFAELLAVVKLEFDLRNDLQVDCFKSLLSTNVEDSLSPLTGETLFGPTPGFTSPMLATPASVNDTSKTFPSRSNTPNSLLPDSKRSFGTLEHLLDDLSSMIDKGQQKSAIQRELIKLKDYIRELNEGIIPENDNEMAELRSNINEMAELKSNINEMECQLATIRDEHEKCHAREKEILEVMREQNNFIKILQTTLNELQSQMATSLLLAGKMALLPPSVNNLDIKFINEIQSFSKASITFASLYVKAINIFNGNNFPKADNLSAARDVCSFTKDFLQNLSNFIETIDTNNRPSMISKLEPIVNQRNRCTQILSDCVIFCRDIDNGGEDCVVEFSSALSKLSDQVFILAEAINSLPVIADSKDQTLTQSPFSSAEMIVGYNTFQSENSSIVKVHFNLRTNLEQVVSSLNWFWKQLQEYQDIGRFILTATMKSNAREIISKASEVIIRGRSLERLTERENRKADLDGCIVRAEEAIKRLKSALNREGIPQILPILRETINVMQIFMNSI